MVAPLRLRSVCVVGLVLALCACGGSSGSSEPPGPLEGTWFSAWLHRAIDPDDVGTINPDLTPACLWGPAVVDGSGGMDLAYDLNAKDQVFSPGGTVEVACDLLADNTFEIAMAAGAPAFLRGGFGGDRQLACAAVVDPDARPSMELFARRVGSYTDLKLLGLYVVAGFHQDGYGIGTLYGGGSLDGAGAGSLTLFDNLGGSVSGPVALSASYSVETDGQIEFHIGALHTLTGQVVQGGDVVVLGGATNTGSPAFLMALVRSSSGRGKADFAGSWFAVGYRADLSAGAFVTATGTVTAVAAGTYTSSLTVADGTTLTPNVAGSGTFDVATTGVMVVGNATGEQFTGAISPDGSCVALAGGTATGQDPVIWFLIRKP